MYNPFGQDVPIGIGICALIAIVCLVAIFIGIVVYLKLEWLFLLVPIATGARAAYFIFRGK